jgi:hypothetical protein
LIKPDTVPWQESTVGYNLKYFYGQFEQRTSFVEARASLPLCFFNLSKTEPATRWQKEKPEVVEEH